MKKSIITLTDRRDVFNFRVGEPVSMAMTWDGKLEPYTWKHKLRALWRRVTWWRQWREQVTEIDPESGTITTRAMFWSWRKWKWL